MKTAFFITSFNDPDSAAISMAQFGPLAKDCDLILSDQSTDPECIERYNFLCKTHGFHRISNENRGASEAKRKVVEIASDSGYTFIHQISEDFELVPDGEHHLAAPLGRESFLLDATMLLDRFPYISFVHWTWFRSSTAWDHGYVWNNPPKGFQLTRTSGVNLSYVSQDVCLMNWPYSGRVSELLQIGRLAQSIVPGCETHQRQNELSGGEWARAFVSKGRGVALYAHPVRHRERVKPVGSLA